MNTYLTIHHKIQSLIGIITAVISLIIAIIMMVVITEPIPTHYDAAGNITDYGSAGFLIFLPVTMLPTILIMAAILRFSPPGIWSLPVKPKPGREPLIYRDVAYMISLLNLEMGVFSLVFTILCGLSLGRTLGIFACFLTAAVTVTIVGVIIKCVIDNRS